LENWLCKELWTCCNTDCMMAGGMEESCT
jgi:hypothetical protein